MEAPTPPTRPQPRPGVLAIAPYVPGKSGATGHGPVHKLSSNENPLGASPNARAAYLAAASQLEVYPDGAATELRAAIAERYGLNAGHIVCGNGSDELLGLIASAYMGEGDEAIFTEHGFLVYRIVTLAAGATPVVVPERDLTADVDAILAAVTDRTRIVFLANPNNPTGTYLPHQEIRRLHAGLPPRVILVLDAAYAEYVRRNDYESGIELVAASDNVVMTRTFSKIYGLAALRLGWAYAPPPIVDAIHRIRGPFNVNAPALAAGAAAIADRAFVEQSVAHNAEQRARVVERLRALGLKVPESVGNFVLVEFPAEPGKTAADADRALTARGVFLRRMEGYGLPHALRMSIGSEEANGLALEVIAEVMAGRHG